MILCMTLVKNPPFPIFLLFLVYFGLYKLYKVIRGTPTPPNESNLILNSQKYCVLNFEVV